MLELLIAVVAALVGGGAVAWRLKAGRTLMQLGAAIIKGTQV